MLARRSLEEGFASEATPKSGFTTGQVSLHHFSSGTIKARWRLHNTFGQPRYSSEACFSATTACGSCVWARQQRWCMSLARLGLFFSEGIHVSSQPTAQLRTHTHSRNECVLSKCPKSLQSHSFLCFFTSFVAKAVQLIETGLTTAGILPPPPEDETCVQASLPAVQRRDALVKSEEVSLLHLPPSERFRCCCRFTRYNSVVRFVSASVPLAGLLRSHFWCSTRRWLGCNLLCDPLLSNSAIAWLARSGSMPP